ncbi:hypothetical protein [Ensifer sp. ENS08]|uniref:hypothetical protein n=1 Tax=Ensifer sp. ENS08 TaxID=2769273 RepID=UPI0017846DF5|nr:hypothetical protein [Ensifer sp. ENS08]MBD9573533.1 hypothetical protein [Ensifer sp. ENS08]
MERFFKTSNWRSISILVFNGSETMARQLIICGPPSQILNATIDLAKCTFQCVFGDFRTFEADAADVLLNRMRESNGLPCILLMQTPEPRMVTSALRNGVRILYVPAKFAESIRFLMQAQPIELQEAIRVVSQSVVSLLPFATSPASLHFDVEQNEFVPRKAILSIASAIDTALTDEEISVIENSLDTQALLGHQGDMHSSRTSEPRASARADDRVLITKTSVFYDTLSSGSDVATPAYWPAELFINGTPPHDHLKEPFKLVGPARFLFFGPYLTLPVGTWRATVSFSIVDNDAGGRVTFDIHSADKILAEGDCDLPVFGSFATNLTFEVVDPTQMIEIRAILRTGMLGGRFELLGVSLERLA